MIIHQFTGLDAAADAAEPLFFFQKNEELAWMNAFVLFFEVNYLHCLY